MGDSACIGPGNTSSLHHSIRVSYKLDPNDVIMTLRYPGMRTWGMGTSFLNGNGSSESDLGVKT